MWPGWTMLNMHFLHYCLATEDGGMDSSHRDTKHCEGNLGVVAAVETMDPMAGILDRNSWGVVCQVRNGVNVTL